MSDSIFLLGDGLLTEVTSRPFDAEADLQQLLADHVHLLPGAQIDRDSPRRWLLIKREAGIPNQEGGGDWWSVTWWSTLTVFIGFANLATRVNTAHGVTSQGYSDACEIPLARRTEKPGAASAA